jgi:hypothetical protein
MSYLFWPSQFHKLLPCAASHSMEQAVADLGSNDVEEGRAVHAIAAQLLHGDNSLQVGMLTANNVMFRTDMLEGIKVYIDDICAANCDELHIEESLSCPAIHAGCGGIPDAWGVKRRERIIYLWDLKWGHRYVDAFENPALMAYVSGIVTALDIDGLAEDYWQVVCTIVQPRSYTPEGAVKRWSCYASEMRASWNKLAAACQDALKECPPAACGSHCRDCRARATCGTLARECSSIAQQYRMSEQFHLTPEQCGMELSRLKEDEAILKARIDGVESSVINALESGKQCGGWQYKSGAGRTIFAHGREAEAIGTAQMLGINIIAPRVPVTVKQAEALGFHPEQYGLTEVQAGKKQLVKVNLNKIKFGE